MALQEGRGPEVIKPYIIEKSSANPFPPRGTGSPEFPREANEVKDTLFFHFRRRAAHWNPRVCLNLNLRVGFLIILMSPLTQRAGAGGARHRVRCLLVAPGHSAPEDAERGGAAARQRIQSPDPRMTNGAHVVNSQRLDRGLPIIIYHFIKCGAPRELLSVARRARGGARYGCT